MQRDLQLIVPRKGCVDSGIEVGSHGGCRLVLIADPETEETMRQAARIAGVPVQRYARQEAAHILRVLPA